MGEEGDRSGPCLTIPTGLRLEEKQEVASECSAPWPCRGHCSVAGTNYEVPCPVGWTTLSAGYCEAVVTEGSRHCPKTVKFVSMNVQQKQDLSHRCNISWPCAMPCEQNFSATCPQHWREVEMNPGICAAPTTYTGDC